MPTLSLTKSEQETHISRCADEDHWTLYCTDPATLPHFLALAEQVGGTVTHAQGGTRILFPQDSIFIGMKRKYNLSPDARAERALQMTQRRTSKPTTHTAPAK